MNARRGVLTAGVGAFAASLAAASVAWGCASVTSPYLDALEPRTGPAETTVVVRGGNWEAHTPVDLSWAPTGQRLGTASPSGGGAFSVRVTIPREAEKGVDYVDYVRATQLSTTKGRTVANTPFGVDSPADDGSPDVPEQRVEAVTSASTSGGTPRRGTTEEQQQTSPSGSTGQAPSGSGGIPARPSGAAAPADSSAAPQADAAPVAGSAPAAAERQRQAAAQAARPGAGSATNSGLNLPAPATPAPATPAPGDGEQRVAAPAGSATGDLWSGFAGGTAPEPGLVSLPEPDRSLSPLAVGVGGLGIGLVALFAGFGLAEVRRRRRAIATSE